MSKNGWILNIEFMEEYVEFNMYFDGDTLHSKYSSIKWFSNIICPADTSIPSHLLILMQQMQRTAMKAPKKTRQAIVRTATFCLSPWSLINDHDCDNNITIWRHLNGSKSLGLLGLCQWNFSHTEAGQWQRRQSGQQFLKISFISRFNSGLGWEVFPGVGWDGGFC